MKKYRLIFGVFVILLSIFFLSVFGSNFSSSYSSYSSLVKISLLLSFIGGALAFLSPCAGFIIPSSSYFAFSKNKFRAFLLFYFGFITLFIPLTFAGSLVARSLSSYTAYFYYFSATFLFFAAFFDLFRSSCQTHQQDEESAYTPYIMGFSYAFTSIGCTGPILGAIITLSYAKGLALLYPFVLAMFFAFGMIVPVILLASFSKLNKPFIKKIFASSNQVVRVFNKDFTLAQLSRFIILIVSGILILTFAGFDNDLYEQVILKILNYN